jgi:hypothetical protein
MAMKFGKYLPKLIITEAMIEAFVDEDYHGLHVLADLKPWEMSPTRCHLWEPARGETPADYRGRPWFASWWKSMALREKLQQLAAKDGIKPSRAALLRKERKEQAELAARVAEKSYVNEIATEREAD